MRQSETPASISAAAMKMPNSDNCSGQYRDGGW
jgi:hypothetical protein